MGVMQQFNEPNMITTSTDRLFSLIRSWLEPKSAIPAPERNPAPKQRQSQLVFLVVARLAGGTRGFAWVFGVNDFDHRHHPVVLVVEDVAGEHELPGEVGEAGT